MLVVKGSFEGLSGRLCTANPACQLEDSLIVDPSEADQSFPFEPRSGPWVRSAAVPVKSGRGDVSPARKLSTLSPNLVACAPHLGVEWEGVFGVWAPHRSSWSDFTQVTSTLDQVSTSNRSESNPWDACVARGCCSNNQFQYPPMVGVKRTSRT